MVKRFTIEPDADKKARDANRNVEQTNSPGSFNRDKNQNTSSVKYWLVGGLCIGLALGLFTKRR
jgi:hypothetical protein